MMASILALLLLAAPSDPELAAHLQRVKASMSHQVMFVEEQGGILLESPLVSRGVLKFRPADRALIKQVNQPQPAELLVTDSRLVINKAGASRSYSLRSRPEMLALLGGFRALLEGDQEALEEHFRAEFVREPQQRWQLSLTPRSKRLEKHLSLVQVLGTGAIVEVIETTLTNGDWQRLRLSAPTNEPQTVDE